MKLQVTPVACDPGLYKVELAGLPEAKLINADLSTEPDECIVSVLVDQKLVAFGSISIEASK